MGMVRGGTAYLEWLRSRLSVIETLNREGSTSDLATLARQLRDSAAAMDLEEITAAAAVVYRACETPSASLDAAVEILHRVVNRVVRKSRPTAA